MTIDELKQMLPFFVAGTLEPEERKEVEEALKSSEALRDNLAFWERTKGALAACAAHPATNHPTPEQIVDRAMGTIPGSTLQLLNQHLQSCAECADEFRRVKESLEVHDAPKPTLFERLIRAVQEVKVVYAVLVGAVAVVVFFMTRTENQSVGPIVPVVAPPPIEEAPADEMASLRLTYEPEMRSASQRRVLSLALSGAEKGIHIFVAIPQSRVSSIRYNLAVELSGRTVFHQKDLLQRYASGGGYDSLHFILPRESLPPVGKALTLTITEILPRELGSLTPEEYRFDVDTKLKEQFPP